ncbi:MAG: KH domain-containing protein [Vicinamibacterales bacterium]
MADLVGLVEMIAQGLADEPGAVEVTDGERRGGRHLELQVAPGDIGRVIGRQGRTAAAIRALLTAAGEREGQRVSLDIRDTSGRR